ncbi:MAG: 4Fe-4S binding protein [Phormidesmis sp. RL_2_1]|nr:4Fe-4S binding protein [Phormidesmis sp. RL_2_1]
MTYAITDKCISCQRCLPACPTNAIEPDGDSFQINADLCNNCRGFYSVPQCWSACPTSGGCVSLAAGSSSFTLGNVLETSTDYWKAWRANYNHRVSRLKSSPQSAYWQNWFDTYSKNLQQLQAQSKEPPSPLTP